MFRIVARWLLFVCLWGVSAGALAQMSRAVDVTPVRVDMSDAIAYRQATPAHDDIGAVMAAAEGWQFVEGATPNLGYSRDAWWLRMDLAKTGNVALERLLVIAYPLLDDVQIFLVRDGLVVDFLHTGDHQPFGKRRIEHRKFLMPLRLEAQSEYSIFLRVQSSSSLRIPVMLWDPHEFHEDADFSSLGLGLFFGGLLIIAAYNFFLWFSVRDAAYLYYVAFVLCFTGLVLALEGLGLQFLWRDQAWWNDRSVVIFGCGTVFFATLFARDFLELRRYNPKLDRVALLYLLFAALNFALAFIIPYRIAIVMLILLSVVWSVMALVFGTQNYRAGNRAARFFIFAWSFLIFCNMFYAAGQLGLIPANFLVNHALQFGEIVEVLALSFALADRINILRKEKSEAMLRAVEADKNAAVALLEANQKLQEALALAEEDHRKKDRFIMAISHELRTPLNAISASVGQLGDVASEDEKRTLQKFIKFGADRLATQVENLIMLAETESNEVKPHVRTFYLDQLLRHAVRVAEAYLFNKPVKFRMERTGADYIAYCGDDYLLVRLLLPVLENACKYTDRGEVVLRTHLGPEVIEFHVSDTGPGIEEKFQEAIYESFTQLSEGYRRTHEGLGIGLTACKRIAHILGATISLYSEPGRGCCFTLRVPMQADRDARPLQEHALAGRALIVEDNLVNAKVLMALVRKFGMDVELAENGEVAVAMARREAFDVVLMDLQMPVMDGFTSAEFLRAEGVRCPILAVTANSDYEARMRCLAVGMNDLIAKPLNRDILREKLSFWLYRHDG